MNAMTLILLMIVLSIIFFILGFLYRKNIGEKKIGSAENLASEIIKKAEAKISEAESKANNIKNNAEIQKKEILIDAKEKSIEIKSNAEEEIKLQKDNLMQHEDRLSEKEEQLEQKRDDLEKRSKVIDDKIKELEIKNKRLEELEEEKQKELKRISGLDAESVKKIFLDEVKSKSKNEATKIIKDIELKTKQEADKKILNILMNAMQRCNIEHITETTVSIVELPSEDMKGKIIGREGRNIRLLENLTGIDFIIDDTPETIVLSGFSAIRRAIAKLALEKLVLDGRIHQTKIEEVVEKAKQEIKDEIYEEGEAATYETGVQNLHPELIRLLGRMKYRTSYGQNALKHSIEVSHLSGLIAGEIGCNIALAKRAGLLHDIGKAVDHETEGSHIQIGASLAKRYGETEIIINAIEAHHGDIEPRNIISVIVQIADAISAARPGARRETLETYIKRLEKLESIPEEFDGIEKAFAIHAGRELRIIVIPEKINDSDLTLLAKEIARKIENELEYPGQIKISIIRETRAIEYAK